MQEFENVLKRWRVPDVRVILSNLRSYEHLNRRTACVNDPGLSPMMEVNRW